MRGKSLIKALMYLTLGFACAIAHAVETVHSYAIVTETGLLRVQGQFYLLHGIDIPDMNYICDATRQISCETQAAVRDLDQKIRGFVFCTVRWRNRDGTRTATCSFDGEDLSAYLIKAGRAAATADAPTRYRLLERIARRQGRGIWSPAYGISDY